ncbi:MAG: RNA polymerase factor sigma-54, partial [Planctomycetota bacterium]
AELEAYIADALETNAALEIADPQPAERETDGTAGANGQTKIDAPEDRGFARLDRFSRDYDLEGIDHAPFAPRRYASDGDRDAKMGAMANTEGREISLHEHLLNQWTMIEVDADVRRAGEVIIGRLDPDGYLRVPIEEITESVRPPLAVDLLNTTLREVQKLEPAGVAARDTVECLLLQLDTLPGDNTIERTLIERHVDDITHNRLPAVAKATGYSIGEINEAIKAMRSSLCLHPGYLVGNRTLPPIRPDVIVEYSETGGGLTVRLTRGNTPHLRVRDDVASLAKSKENGKETREFARKHIEEAAALIDAVNFRRHRLLEVARAIAEKQRDFFDVGPSGLKVLRMSDLAAELGCDPSTVSRTVADKYLQTPRGIFPLRYFFTGGTETEDGETVGWDRVKLRVRELVDAEDRKSPLNDDHIAALLKKEGIDISRRTVAKYRQQLNLPAARQRRQF